MALTLRELAEMSNEEIASLFELRCECGKRNRTCSHQKQHALPANANDQYRQNDDVDDVYFQGLGREIEQNPLYRPCRH